MFVEPMEKVKIRTWYDRVETRNGTTEETDRIEKGEGRSPVNDSLRITRKSRGTTGGQYLTHEEQTRVSLES